MASLTGSETDVFDPPLVTSAAEAGFSAGCDTAGAGTAADAVCAGAAAAAATGTVSFAGAASFAGGAVGVVEPVAGATAGDETGAFGGGGVDAATGPATVSDDGAGG